jgi:ATP-dependent protease Clp ATPase subunit
MFVLWKKKETQLLIAGIDAHICDKCIEQAHGIVLEEIKQRKHKLASIAKTKRN